MKEIVQDGSKVLREIATPVPESLFGSAELSRLVNEMSEALDRYPEGVAIAAPQIGVSYRLFIVRKDRTIPPPKATEGAAFLPASKIEMELYINPEIVKTSHKSAKTEEGCLSVHGVYGTTKRHERVTIKARLLDGSPVERGASGLMAQIFEHEIDHLNGILFIDHAERLIKIPHESSRRFAYFGTPKVASDTLFKLLERGFIPSVVITSPDTHKGRGLALAPSETKVLALAYNIPVLTPKKLDEETIATISAFECDYAVCVAYGKIFPESLINTFSGGVLNVHYSLLPKYRGATPLETALRDGETVTGVTIQKMAKELDAGDILAQEATPIRRNETAREVRPRLIEMGANLLIKILPKYMRGTIIPVVQDSARATRAYKIKKEDGLISLDAPAEENWNKYRAYADTIGTYFFSAGGGPASGGERRMKITKASFVNGTFVIERVVPEGKREMAYAASQQARKSM